MAKTEETSAKPRKNAITNGVTPRRFVALCNHGLARILDRADELGMAPLLGLFYFGQDQRLRDEAAVQRAADAVTDWLLARGDRHVLIEIANEVDVPRYDHPILRAERCGSADDRSLLARRAHMKRDAALPLQFLHSVVDDPGPHHRLVDRDDLIDRQARVEAQVGQHFGQINLAQVIAE